MKKLGGCFKLIGGAMVLLVVLALVFGGGSSDDNKVSSDSGSDKGQVSVSEDASDTGEDEPEEPAEEPQEKYTITDEKFDASNPYTASITGKLTNNTDREISYLQIEYTLYDEEGNQIGTAWANCSNLKAGGTWKFEATTFESPDEIASYELTDVTGF